MNLSIEEILKAANGEIVQKGSEKFKKISTDTRKIEKDSLFIALNGDNFNGNLFVNDAVKKGASVCIIDEVHFDEKSALGATIIKVDNTKKALLDIAEFYRQKLNIKVVGVTGSNGKTSTKDLIAAVLSEKYKVFKTKGNFNNEIGVPLMIFELDDSYDVAVIEMGMSNLGEIHRLAKAARPDIAVITNIGISHIENLKTRDNILKAKLEITDYLKEGSSLILNGSDDKLCDVKDDRFNIIKVASDNLEYSIQNIIYNDTTTGFDTIINNEKQHFIIPILGKHNVYNTLLAIAVGQLLNVNVSEMKHGLTNNLEATSMRLDIVKKHDYTIINDCYNSSPASVKAALEVQKNVKCERRVAILGTMKELGEKSKEAHYEIGTFARENNIDMLLVTGDYSEDIIKGYNLNNAYIYESVQELIDDLKNRIQKGDSILVKASRSMKFERIVKALDTE